MTVRVTTLLDLQNPLSALPLYVHQAITYTYADVTNQKPDDQTPWCMDRPYDNRCHAIPNSTCAPESLPFFPQLPASLGGQLGAIQPDWNEGDPCFGVLDPDWHLIRNMLCWVHVQTPMWPVHDLDVMLDQKYHRVTLYIWPVIVLPTQQFLANDSRWYLRICM